jgi:hypothetical protein
MRGLSCSASLLYAWWQPGRDWPRMARDGAAFSLQRVCIRSLQSMLMILMYRYLLDFEEEIHIITALATHDCLPQVPVAPRSAS